MCRLLRVLDPWLLCRKQAVVVEAEGDRVVGKTVLLGSNSPQLVLYLRQVGHEKQPMTLLGRQERRSPSLMQANALPPAIDVANTEALRALRGDALSCHSSQPAPSGLVVVVAMDTTQRRGWVRV